MSKDRSNNGQLVPMRTASLPVTEVLEPTNVPLEQHEIALIEQAAALVRSRSVTSLVQRRSGMGALIRPNAKPVKIGGKEFQIDAEQLMRMIKRVTQSVGEFKLHENAYSQYVIPALRKARGEMVSDLEHYFGVHFRVDEDGKSEFTL